jgi:hypothetical protein
LLENEPTFVRRKNAKFESAFFADKKRIIPDDFDWTVVCESSGCRLDCFYAGFYFNVSSHLPSSLADLPFRTTKPGKYKLLMEISEADASQSTTARTDVQFVTN